LYLSRKDSDTMKGKRVLIMDDVISTGDSLRAIEELAKSAQAVIIGKAAVLAEGDAADRDDIIFLEKLPLFPKSK
ncbi:MAG: adenine phosphoribosyltransferase, partial [Ruminococcus sp.]|nr:adenine phosphoribosyltransferase [Ruminococcus sp.]